MFVLIQRIEYCRRQKPVGCWYFKEARRIEQVRFQFVNNLLY